MTKKTTLAEKPRDPESRFILCEQDLIPPTKRVSPVTEKELEKANELSDKLLQKDKK